MSEIKYYDELLQGTDEWLQARCGIVTASVVKDLFTSKFKLAANKTVDNLAYKLASERITGVVEMTGNFYQMERGHVEEEVARDIYSAKRTPVTECGFVTNNKHGVMIGWSPDGLVGEDGCIEIKSRINKLQVQTIIEQETPSEYMCQIQTALLVSERPWIDLYRIPMV